MPAFCIIPHRSAQVRVVAQVHWATINEMWSELRLLHKVLLSFCIVLGVAWIAFGYVVALQDPGAAGAEFFVSQGCVEVSNANAAAGPAWPACVS